ncbi:prolyl oligopeptidase [Neoconidiobolus thromboides FSU 785]|nr:prolyl oligopeptidase [Neoconidiobolus thromboides FSU 785]
MNQFISLILTTVLLQVTAKSVPKDDGRQTSQWNKLSLPWEYPEARVMKSYYDTYHGIGVRDPYHWLETHTSQETRTFWDKNNKLLHKYLNQNPHKQVIYDSVKTLFSAPSPGKPVKHGDYYYYTERASLQGNSVLYRKKNLADQPQVVLDPNPLSPDETAYIKFNSFSSDNKYLLIAVSRKGSDWTDIRVHENNEGLKELERLIWTQDGGVTWSTDDKGFFYSKDPAPKGITWEDAGLNTDPGLDNRLYYHRVGTQQKDDILIWAGSKDSAEYPSIEYAGPNNEYFILQLYRSTADRTYTYYADATDSNKNGVTKKPDFKNIYHDYDGIAQYLESVNEKEHLFLVTRGTPYRKIVQGTLENLRSAKDVLPEQKGYGLIQAKFGKDKIAASYIKDSTYHIKVFNKNDTSKAISEIDLPIGGIKGFKFIRDETAINFNVTDFFSPTVAYEVELNDTKNNKLIYTEPSLPGFKPELFEMKLEHYKSKDGTIVPITLAYRKGTKLDGNNNVYLYGYGGFNSINTPAPRAHWLAMLQSLDLVLAIAHIRGGGENGDPWYTSASRLNKQVSYDDFEYASKFLVNKKYTQHNKIVVNGRSNGGTLSGVSFTQAPELFGAVVADVGVMDLVRYQSFNDGTGWFDDFGDVIHSKEEFLNVLKFSPYHNIRCNRPYPPLLITTGSHDDRVSTLHSLKFAARLQSHYKDHKHPILLQTANNTGHGCTGCGKPVKLDINDKTNMLTFISMVFNIVPKPL